MAPFRTRADQLDETPGAPASAVVRDAVGAMVRQFADRLALLRELVQNGIDAGATRIDVRLSFLAQGDDASSDPRDARRGSELRIAVHDDGHGMTLDVIERCLLTLFRSSKEGDRTKIGKFGVGFFSVFALEPAMVRVDTSTGSESHRVLVRPDFSYEVELADPRAQGTVVTLRVPASTNEARELARQSLAALERWCPHVEVVLHAASDVPGAAYDQRIDSPLALEAPVAVFVRDDDGTSFALALGHATTGTALYKRGILLRELGAELAPAVRARIDAPSLSHTLSRDDVRRDAAFERVLARAIELVQSRLRDEALRAFNRAALACAEARAGGVLAAESVRDELIATAGFLSHTLDARVRGALRWPLLEALSADAAGGDRVLVYASAPPWAARESTAVTRGLAARGAAVLDLGAAGPRGEAALISLAKSARAEAEDPHASLCAPCVCDEASLEGAPQMLLEALRGPVLAVGLKGVAFARPVGLGEDQMTLAMAPATLRVIAPTTLLDRSDVQAGLFGILGARALVLNLAHGRVQAALRACAHDAPMAAAALLRAALLAHGKLSAKSDLALLDACFGGARES